MKLLFYLSAVFVVEATINICIPPPSQPAANPDVLKEINEKIVEKLRRAINENEPDFETAHADVNITHYAIRIEGTVDNVKIYGLSNYEICFLDNIFINSSYYQFDPFNITFWNISVGGQYNFTGDLGDIFDIYGAGDFRLDLHNFSVALFNFTFNVNEEVCFPVNLKINLPSVFSNFSKFMFDPELEELFNNCIMSILPDIMPILWGEWQEIFDKPLEDAINDFLHHKNQLPSVINLIENMKSGQTLSPKFCFGTEDTETTTAADTETTTTDSDLR